MSIIQSICEQFHNNADIDPRTGIKIKPTDEIYINLVKECGSPIGYVTTILPQVRQVLQPVTPIQYIPMSPKRHQVTPITPIISTVSQPTLIPTIPQPN